MIAARRQFLKMIGLTPLAAKISQDQEIGKLAGITRSPPPDSIPMAGGMNTQSKKMMGWLLNPKIPSWYEEELRYRYRHVTHLDPDLASKRAWSMSVKIQEQRQRNMERAKQDMVSGARRSVWKDKFLEKYGIWL